MTNNITTPDQHFLGHRQRLKEKFLSSNHKEFADYELLELVLFNSIPRKDVKPLAKKLLQEFGNIRSVIGASEEKLIALEGITKSTCINFAVMNEILNRSLQSQIMKKNILSSWAALMDYLRISMGDSKTEQFRTLFLNKKNILIADELETTGTVDQTPVYTREIVKRALFHEASAIILVHNHPSGDPTPSKADIVLTNQIVEACKTFNIMVHDHIIITNDDFYSFKSNLLI